MHPLTREIKVLHLRYVGIKLVGCTTTNHDSQQRMSGQCLVYRE